MPVTVLLGTRLKGEAGWHDLDLEGGGGSLKERGESVGIWLVSKRKKGNCITW